MPFPFLRLPRELRDRIYHFVFVDSTIRILEVSPKNDSISDARANKKQYMFFYLEYCVNERSDIETCEEDDLMWLLAHPGIQSEALEQFYRHAHCSRYWRWDRAYDGCEFGESNPLHVFSMARVKSLDLYLQLGSILSRTDKEYLEIVVPRRTARNPLADEDLVDILSYLKSISLPSLEHITLTVWLFQRSSRDDSDQADGCRSWSDPDGVSGFEIDLGFLRGFGNGLKHVEVRLYPTFVPVNGRDLIPENIIAAPILQRKLCQAAKDMVGGEDWALIDWIEQHENAQRWCLDVKRGEAGQREGALQHTGLRTWPGGYTDQGSRDDDIFVLQCKGGNAMTRWKGEKSGEIVEVHMPVTSCFWR